MAHAGKRRGARGHWVRDLHELDTVAVAVAVLAPVCGCKGG